MKKRLLSLAVVLICVSILTGGTFAYFSTDDTAHNVITTHKVDVEIIEQKLKNGSLVDFGNDKIQVMPGIKVSKIVSVKNNEATSWIRMKYEVTMFDADGNIKDVSAELMEDLVIIEPDIQNWTEKDGWWYYRNPVKTGETTSPVFEAVAFSGPEMRNEYQNCTIKINIIAQAVQKDNNRGGVLEAGGWPEE